MSTTAIRLTTPTLAVLALAVGLSAGTAHAAVATCGTATAPAGFTVQTCITAPASGATVSGAVPVTATVIVTGPAPPVDDIQYTLDGAPILADFQAPYAFTLHTYLYGSGTHTLGASTQFSGGYNAPAVSVTLSFGPASAPAGPPAFTPKGTAPAAGQPTIVAAGGDGATGLAAQQQVANLIASWNPNMFLYLGDVYNGGTSEEFLNWYGENGSLFNRFFPITDPTPGDHEYSVDRQAQPYLKYFGNVPHYYSFNQNGWHVISLDDNGEFGQNSTTAPMYTWLANDLDANTTPCTLVEWHRPVYSVDPGVSATDFAMYWQLLTAHHVPLVVAGSSHNYQRWRPLDGNGNVSPTGTTEIISGTTGQWISPLGGTDPRLAAGFGTTATGWGATELTLNPAGATYRFENISGVTEDYGSLPCTGASDATAPNAPTNVAATAVSG
ncbi:MAG TPA: Ig-like domain-containing protein, partial [Pseudonocardiaceae bacterium]|nr:Ig-like domain-containing protein [Pseudonocardiaceae bacterium]